MEIHLTPEQQTQLERIARMAETTTERIVEHAVARYLDEEICDVDAVAGAEAALDRGEYLTHEQVGRRLERFLKA